METSPQKQKEQRQKQLDFSFFLMSFLFLYILNSLHFLLLFTFWQVCLPVKEIAEIVTGMEEKSSWDQANIRQKLGLVWINRKKTSQIIKDYFYLPFFLLIILWVPLSADLIYSQTYSKIVRTMNGSSLSLTLATKRLALDEANFLY
jgi:hypothetical protein